MNKIISIDKIKQYNNTKFSDYSYLPKINTIYNLIDCNNNKKALEISEQLFYDYGYIDKVCEILITCIMLNVDYINDYKKITRYYFILKKAYDILNYDELICSYIGSFILAKYKNIKPIENIDFIINKFFKDMYHNFPENENIVYQYSSALLLNLDNFYNENNDNRKIIFDDTIKTYLNLIISSEDFDYIIASELSKFLYLASLKAEDNKYILENSSKLLKELYIDYDDDEEIALYYCLYISKHYITDYNITTLKAIDEFKKITNNFDTFIFKELFFLSLNNFVANEKFQNSKFAVAYMRNIIYSLNKDDPISDLCEIFAETLSNCSCDQGLNVQTINDEILPLISAIIKDFGENENIINEYCIVLYNMSCLLNFYNDENAPYTDVIEELLNCAMHFDNAIPYYCLSLSNLIHLNDRNFGLEVTTIIKSFLDEFDEFDIPKTKNNISLTSIYVVSMTNLVNKIEIDEAYTKLLQITNIIDNTCTSLNIDLEKEYDSEKLSYIYQYLRALSYYYEKLKKENINSKQITEIDNLLKKIDYFLQSQEI